MEKGIEKITKVMMFNLFAIMFVLAINRGFLKGYYDFFSSKVVADTDILLVLDVRGICWMIFALVVIVLVLYVSSAKGKEKAE